MTKRCLNWSISCSLTKWICLHRHNNCYSMTKSTSKNQRDESTTSLLSGWLFFVISSFFANHRIFMIASLQLLRTPTKEMNISRQLRSLQDCALQWDNEVLLSIDWPPGTVCHLHYEPQSCHRTPSQCTEDAPVLDCPAMLRRFYTILAPNTNAPTYLLRYL